MKHGWEYKKLGEVCTLTMGQSPASESYNSESDGLPFFQGCSDFGKINPTIRIYCNAPTKIAEANDVLMSVRAPIGTLNIANVRCCIGRGLASFRATTKATNSYLYYFLKHSRNKLEALGTGSTFKAIGKDALFKFPIPIPPIKEQEEICSLLDKLSLVIEKKKQQVKELDNLAQAIFYDMFGDPITNTKGWEKCELNKNVEEMFLGPFGSSLKVDSYVDKGSSYCMVYEQKHAIQAKMDFEDTHYINEEKYNSLKRFTVVGGDFIMSCRGTIGRIFQLPLDAPLGIIHPSLMKIRIKNSYSPVFFKFLLTKTMEEQVTNGNCVQMAITAKELGKKHLVLPPLSLQQSFAQKVESIERQKELINQSIAEVQTLFDSQMEYYFGE